MQCLFNGLIKQPDESTGVLEREARCIEEKAVELVPLALFLGSTLTLWVECAVQAVLDEVILIVIALLMIDSRGGEVETPFPCKKGVLVGGNPASATGDDMKFETRVGMPGYEPLASFLHNTKPFHLNGKTGKFNRKGELR
jgi:hypothetical protein